MSDNRLEVTAVIWGMYVAALAVAGIFFPGQQDLAIVIAVFGALGAMVSSVLFWAFHAYEMRHTSAVHDVEKAKRGGERDNARLALLLQLMTDDERRTLSQRLAEDLGTDGELPLAALLDDETSRERGARRE